MVLCWGGGLESASPSVGSFRLRLISTQERNSTITNFKKSHFLQEGLFLVSSINHYSLLATTDPTGKMQPCVAGPTWAHPQCPPIPPRPCPSDKDALQLQDTAEREETRVDRLGYALVMGDVPLLQQGKRSHNAAREHAQGHTVNQCKPRTQQNYPLPPLQPLNQHPLHNRTIITQLLTSRSSPQAC